ncbi:uncharacterized protein METZ01_LOCUS507042 [marine metagenome]|uniref:Glutaredoxin domain-containing protein n=1 Tax=marine metagenome TaxID=408172 RepID=A0A383EDJ4_9ZZZZ
MSSETVIYISKRCPYCRQLLVKIQQREDIKGTVKVSSIDDEPFPNIIKNVPSMVSEGVLYNAEEIFRMLAESEQQQQQKQPEQQPSDESKPSEDDMYSGYCENGSCLAFSSLGSSQSDGEYTGQFAPLDHNPNSVDVSEDGYKKSSGIDNEYERMMKERGELNNNQQIR